MLVENVKKHSDPPLFPFVPRNNQTCSYLFLRRYYNEINIVPIVPIVPAISYSGTLAYVILLSLYTYT